NYEMAREQFEVLVERYPTHDKAPGALLKIGLSQYGLRDLDGAESTLAQVAERFPGTDAARTAEDRLHAIQLARATRWDRRGRRRARPGRRPGGPAPHHRDLPVAAGRGARRRLAHGLRPPDRLSAALPLLRHRLCLPRGRVVGPRRDRGRGGPPRRAPC